MKKLALIAALFCLPLMFTTPASAQASGTSAEAKAMLEKAVAALKADQTKAIADFNASPGPFKDRDLYVFCFNASDGKIISHPSLIGTDVRSLKEKSGKAFGEDIYKAAEEGKVNTVAYMFPRPGTTDPVAKESYVTRVGGTGCGVGYYK